MLVKIGQKNTQNNNKKFNYLTDPNFQKVNKLFVMAFKNFTERKSFCNYYLTNIRIET